MTNLLPFSRTTYWMALRDINDGHIGVYATVERFDTATGVAHPEPVVLGVGFDRLPTGARADLAWWEPFIANAHLELAEGADRWFYRVTDAGRDWLAENRPPRYGRPSVP